MSGGARFKFSIMSLGTKRRAGAACSRILSNHMQSGLAILIIGY